MDEVDESEDLLLVFRIGLLDLQDLDFGPILEEALAFIWIRRVQRRVHQEHTGDQVVLDRGQDEDWGGLWVGVHGTED